MAKKKEPKPTPVDDFEEIETMDSDLSLDDDLPQPKSKSSDIEDVETEDHPEAPAVKVPIDRKRIEALEAAITPAGEERGKLHRFLFYGMNKTGKTTLLDHPSVLILNTEDGTTSISDKPFDERALQLPVHVKDDVESTYWMLAKAPRHPSGVGIVVKYRDPRGGVKERHITVLAVDTVTRLIDRILRSVVLGDRAKDPTITEVMATMPQRGRAYDFANTWLLLLRNLPLHTVWLCQERMPKESDQEQALGLPDLPRSVRNIIQGDAEVIGHLYKHEPDVGDRVEFRIQFGASTEYVTGDRYKVLPKTILAGVDGEEPKTSIVKLIRFIDKKLAERRGE